MGKYIIADDPNKKEIKKGDKFYYLEFNVENGRFTVATTIWENFPVDRGLNKSGNIFLNKIEASEAANKLNAFAAEIFDY